MAEFYRLPEFDKELKKLSKKYPSIEFDIEDIKPIILDCPTGIGKNFVIIKSTEKIKIVKVDIHCESLRKRSIRLIYSYSSQKVEFMFIELYFKGDKVSEDRGRIEAYIKSKNL